MKSYLQIEVRYKWFIRFKKFREHLLNDDRFITSYYEVGDGIAVSVRKK